MAAPPQLSPAVTPAVTYRYTRRPTLLASPALPTSLTLRTLPTLSTLPSLPTLPTLPSLPPSRSIYIESLPTNGTLYAPLADGSPSSIALGLHANISNISLFYESVLFQDTAGKAEVATDGLSFRLIDAQARRPFRTDSFAPTATH